MADFGCHFGNPYCGGDSGGEGELDFSVQVGKEGGGNIEWLRVAGEVNDRFAGADCLDAV